MTEPAAVFVPDQGAMIWDGSAWQDACEGRMWTGSEWRQTDEGYMWTGSVWAPMCTVPRAARGPIRLAGSWAKPDVGTTTHTIFPTQATAEGATLVLIVGTSYAAAAASTVTSVTDPAGNTWTRVGQRRQNASTLSGNVEVWACYRALSVPSVVAVVSKPSSQTPRAALVLAEVHGETGWGKPTVSAGAGSWTTVSYNPDTGTLPSAGAGLVVAASARAGFSMSTYPGAPWTKLAGTSGSNNINVTGAIMAATDPQANVKATGWRMSGTAYHAGLTVGVAP